MSPPVTLALARVADSAAQAEAGGLAWLGDAERTRVGAITAPVRRAQFIAGRWTLRRLLAAELGGHLPPGFTLSAPHDGPPRLERPGAPSLHLAVSHSGDWLACAVSPAPIGLDIEVPRPRRNLAGLIEAVCTPAEREALAALDPEAAQRRFFLVWTLKEAWLKQRLQGVSLDGLAQLDTGETTATDADARAWVDAACTLALVAPASATVRWHGGGLLENSLPSHWRVSQSAGAGVASTRSGSTQRTRSSS